MKKETFLNASISVMQTSFKTQKKHMFRCETCNYKTESERGLKIHIKRKHKIVQDTFPQICDFCEYKAHSKSICLIHFYKRAPQEMSENYQLA